MRHWGSLSEGEQTEMRQRCVKLVAEMDVFLFETYPDFRASVLHDVVLNEARDPRMMDDMLEALAQAHANAGTYKTEYEEKVERGLRDGVDLPEDEIPDLGNFAFAALRDVSAALWKQEKSTQQLDVLLSGMQEVLRRDDCDEAERPTLPLRYFDLLVNTDDQVQQLKIAASAVEGFAQMRGDLARDAHGSPPAHAVLSEYALAALGSCHLLHTPSSTPGAADLYARTLHLLDLVATVPEKHLAASPYAREYSRTERDLLWKAAVDAVSMVGLLARQRPGPEPRRLLTTWPASWRGVTRGDDAHKARLGQLAAHAEAQLSGAP
jgi:hypothetical protein